VAWIKGFMLDRRRAHLWIALFGIGCLLMFHGILRPGESLRLDRRHVKVPADRPEQHVLGALVDPQEQQNYETFADDDRLQARHRVAGMASLEHYIQEVAASMIITDMPRWALQGLQRLARRAKVSIFLLPRQAAGTATAMEDIWTSAWRRAGGARLEQGQFMRLTPGDNEDMGRGQSKRSKRGSRATSTCECWPHTARWVFAGCSSRPPLASWSRTFRLAPRWNRELAQVPFCLARQGPPGRCVRAGLPRWL
jgi:hypothetical protein